MIRQINKDIESLSQKAVPATVEDIPVADDLLETLKAHADACVGMAANMIGVPKAIIVFDNDTPTGYVAGASTEYDDEEIEVIAKNLTEIEDGDVIDFICDYYTYDGEYQDSYRMIEPITVDGGLKVSDVTLPGGSVRLTYRLTDIYNQAYWTETINH